MNFINPDMTIDRQVDFPFSHGRDIAIDPLNNWVVRKGAIVDAISFEGEFVRRFQAVPEGRYDFRDLCVDNNGMIFVLCTDGRIMIYRWE